MTVLLVVAGAAVGAPLRFLTDRWVQGRHDSVFPWGTFAVNVVGCLVMGAVSGAVGAGAPVALRTGLGTGFCGALTTYSTFSYETLRLAEDDARLFAVANVLGSIVVGVAAAFLGVWLGRTMWG
ncbi:MAG: fluoride efflux transporter CrcB [Oryzihumus sp.]